MAQPKVTVTLDGPFFSADTGAVITKNIHAMLEAVAAEDEGEVTSAIRGNAGGMPNWTGWTADSITGRVAGVNGHSWHEHAVVSPKTAGMSRKDAIRTLAAASGIERRWHPFRRVATATRKAIREANLTRNLE